MSALSFAPPVKQTDGSYFVKITAQDGSPVYITQSNSKLKSMSDTEVVFTLSDSSVISSWDANMIAEAVLNSSTWFNKEISVDVITTYYQSSFDDSTGILETVPALRKGKPDVGMFDTAKNPVKTIEAGTVCNVLLQLDGLWFLRKTFGPIWKTSQMRIKKTVTQAPCMVQDEDDED